MKMWCKGCVTFYDTKIFKSCPVCKVNTANKLIKAFMKRKEI